MDITILNTYTEVIKVSPNWKCLWVSLAVGAIFAIILALVIRGGFKKFISVFLVSTILFSIVQIPWTITLMGDKTYETRYEVVVGDDVSMNDFNDKYDIVSQRGDIIVVRDKQ